MTLPLPGWSEISPRTDERRSPRALAHDPPVRKTEWVVGAGLGPGAFLLTTDAFLADARERAGLDQVAWERVLRHGGLHLDRRRWDAAAPPALVPSGTSVVCYSYEREPVPLELGRDAILLDRDGLVAVDKPPWWAVQGTRASTQVSLERALRERLDCPKLTPCHRLDRETSGVLLFARDGKVAAEVGRQLARQEVEKRYLAVVHPAPERGAWEVRGVMARVAHPSHSLFELRPAGEEGQASTTRFEVAAREGERALVLAEPLTGRTHQLRVHLTAGGTPIVGDSLYGGGWSPGHPWSAERLQLHAASVELRFGGQPLRVEAPLPASFVMGR